MKLIVGLGNPEKRFQNTRHNLGFIVVDYLAKKLNVELNKVKFNGLYNLLNFENQTIILLKPQNYMNNSGYCVNSFINYYQISYQDVLIIYDDLTIPLCQIRYRQEGSSGGHNGIKSIISCLQTSNIQRLKIGIGYQSATSWDKWVLQSFSTEEQKQIKQILPTIFISLIDWITNKINFQKLMERYNGKN